MPPWVWPYDKFMTSRMKPRDVSMTPRVTLNSPFIENISKTICIIRDTNVMSATIYCMHDIYNTLGEIRRLTYSTINETISTELITIITSTIRKV